MMGPGGITVVLAMYWLTGVVGAASLPPGDQYSPQQSPYRRDISQGLRGYPTWLKYQQDSPTRLEPPDNKSDGRRLDDSDFPRKRMSQVDSAIRDLDLVPLAPGGWNVAVDVTRSSSKSARKNLDVVEDSKISSGLVKDYFVEDDGFQDQGPGSVEVYKLDLHRENSLLVPHANEKQLVVGARTKSKIPKKARAEEILWKLKSMDSRKASLPAIFRQPPHSHKDSTLPRESRRKIKENRKDEVFAVGGVPELQVGCEGLEASERDKRSSGPGVENIDEIDWDNSHKYKDPVYRESTEPILLRVTPIVLDVEEEEPPSGEIYEELDELLKLKKLEATSPKPTTRRWNRADIDPALEIDKHQEERMIETFPERGDLGPSNGSISEVKEGSIAGKDFGHQRSEKSRFRRNVEDESLNRQGGRKLLWVQYPEREEQENRVTKMRHHEDGNDYSDPWGFGEEEGDLFDSEDDADVDKLREAEAEKRRREYERRRQEELNRRHAEHDNRRHESHPSRSRDAESEIERIRQDYERQLEKEQRERQRIEEERRRQGDHRRGEEDDQKRLEAARRRQDEELRRRLEEEQRRNRNPWNSRSREEEDRRREWNRRREEEERLRRLENQRNHQDPPASLTRPEPPHHPGNMSRSRQEKEDEERKLREYIDRNRPIDPKRTGNRRRPEEQSTRNEDDERRRYMEEQRRRQMEEHRRRQLDEEERQRQMEEHRRRQHQPDEDERRKQVEEHRRRQMDEQRRRDRPENRAMEEERRRRVEEERKLQEYVRRNQPVNVPRRNNSEASISSQESRDLEDQRRTLEAARQWERNRRPIVRGNDGRIHGPSAPTSIGQRQSQYDLEEIRRRQERLEEERRRESDWRRRAEEERRREAEIRRAESRRYEEERKRLEAAARKDEENRRAQSEGRGNSWQDSAWSRRPVTGSRRYDPTDEVRDREAEELHRQEAADRTTGNTMRNRDRDEWRRRAEERDRQRKQQEERERQRLENERNFRNNERRRPQHEDSGPKPKHRGESFRGSQDEIEWRRREHARLSSLPVRATIVIRSDGTSKNSDGTSLSATLPTPLEPSIPSFGSRGNFGNEIDFPAINPNRPGLAAPTFPAPPTARPPIKSPGACVWAIVQCCPANNRLTTCFESLGCPGVNWDPNPCRGSLADAARAEIGRFYAAADEANVRS